MKYASPLLILSLCLALGIASGQACCAEPDLPASPQAKFCDVSYGPGQAVVHERPKEKSPDPPADSAPAAAAEPSIAPPPAVSPVKSARGMAAALEQKLEPKEAAPPAVEPEQPWRLPQLAALEKLGIGTSGWLEQGISFNNRHPGDQFAGPVACNDLDHEYQMNQLWMVFERPVKTGAGWDFGGRVDTMLGTDWRFNINHGLEDRIDGFNDQTYGMAIPQAYAEVACDDLSVKLGHFAAMLDYETVPAPTNPFYSHSYCYSYCVPTLVTGALADYRLDEQWSVQGGFHRGWAEFEDNNHTLDVMGGVRWRSDDERTMVSYGISNGPQDAAALQNRFVYSLMVKERLTKRAEYVLVHDLGVETNALPNGRQAQWYGVNQYYLYSLSQKWSLGLRAEWLRDDDGAAVAGPGNITGVRAWAGHGFAGDFYEVTAGVNWKPQANLIFRPEVRYDWYTGALGGYGASNTPGLPFNDGRSNSQLLTAADLILLF